MRYAFLDRARALARRASDLLPPTWLGAFAALFSLLALWRFGYGDLDLLLFVVGVAGLVLVALAAVTVAAAALYVKRRVEPGSTRGRRLEARSPIRTGFRVPALQSLPLVQISWRWLEPEGVECRTRLKGRELEEEVIATRRGQVAAIRRRFVVRDAFGLARVAWERTDPTPLTVLPWVGRLRGMPPVQPMAAAEGLPHPAGAPEGDRMEIRRYVPGDSVRHILWKTYARTGTLNVRLPERSVERARKTVAYLLTGPDDEAAAAAARVALESRILGMSWRFGADGTAEPAESLDAALEVIARSGSYRNGSAPPAAGLARFLAGTEQTSQVHCLVFAPARAGAWTAGALAAARGFSGAVSFVLGTDGVIQERSRPLWRRFLFQPNGHRRGITGDELRALLGTLTSAGCGAMVVDRTSGRSFGASREGALVLHR